MATCIQVGGCILSKGTASPQTCDVGSPLACCWASVVDGGPTANQRWPNVSFLLGWAIDAAGLCVLVHTMIADHFHDFHVYVVITARLSLKLNDLELKGSAANDGATDPLTSRSRGYLARGDFLSSGLSSPRQRPCARQSYWPAQQRMPRDTAERISELRPTEREEPIVK